MKQKSLLKNTFFLYILTFSNYLFGLLTLPYETRILGPEHFGILGFAAAFYSYFFIILDFGFILSGTKKVSEYSTDRKELGRVITGITISKIMLFCMLTLLLVFVSIFSNRLALYFNILFLYLILAFLTSLIPDYFYRGIENMKMVTFRTVLIKFIFTCLIFIFLKHPEQYFYVPLFNILGTIIALIWVIYDIKYNHKIYFERVSISYVLSLLKDTAGYFLSRIATTIYSATNTVIIGFIYPTGNTLGYFTSSDKVRNLASQAASPIADSFYPYMIRTKDYKKLIKITIGTELLIIIGCIILWIFSEELCVIAFGQEFRDAAPILRTMIPLILIVLPNYMFGFPGLSPLGMAKWANYSVEIAMSSQLVGLMILFLLNIITVKSIIILTIISEILCLSTRISAFIYGVKTNKVLIN